MAASYMNMHLWMHLTEEFLKHVCQKYHYDETDIKKMKKVANDIIICLKEKEAVYLTLPEECMEETFIPVVMTLGRQIDVLEERYQNSDRLQEAYMLEHICNELLFLGYQQLQYWIEKNTKWKMTGIHFVGSDEEFPLEQMPDILRQMGQRQVSCTKDYCLMPQKSTVFFAKLSNREQSQELHICNQCNRRESCEQRMRKML